MRTFLVCLALASASWLAAAEAQAPSKTLVAVLAHPDDESAASPILARYAREGVQVHLVIATDGAAGGQQTSIPRGPGARARPRRGGALRDRRARRQRRRSCSDSLTVSLATTADDPLRLFKLTQRLHEELQRLRPDALITWGPDGGTGHPDHRLVSAVVTQLVRTGAPGVPERLFYASLPAEAMRVVNPSRGAPPLLIPEAKHLTTRVSFTPADLEAAHRSLSCHKTQFPPEVIARVAEAAKGMWNGVVPLTPAFAGGSGQDLFR